MSAKWLRVAIGVSLSLAVFVAGYAVGHRRTFAWLNGTVTLDTQFNLAHRVDTLAKLRTGDHAAAIAGLEQVVDTASVNLAQGKPWSELAPDVRRSLQLAKAYRSRYPPAKPSPELSALLESTPMPDVQYCSPALQELLRTGAGKGGGQ